MKSTPEIDDLVRRAEQAGGKVLRTRMPGDPTTEPGPASKGPAQPPPSKYRNVRQVHNGVRYDSRAEARRAAELDALSASLGLWYVRQPTFHLGCPENTYRADFLVVMNGKVHVEDVKGYPTPKFLHDVRLWKAHGPCQLWVRGRNGIEYVNGGKWEEALAEGTAGESSYHNWSEVLAPRGEQGC